MLTKPPVKRTRIRRIIGYYFFLIKKKIYWYLSLNNFANKFEDKLPHEIFSHRSTLRRNLKNEELWMQDNKITNLKIAMKCLSGLVIEPGQTLSYWRQVGNTTRRKGYLEGMVLSNGQVQSGVGGGLCQLSNLIYWMTLHTPLTVLERWRHSYDVFPDVKRNQPFGSGATCSYPNIDLQIKNETMQTFQLILWLDEEYLQGQWLSNRTINFRYNIFEKNHHFKSEWFGGYSRNNQIFREVVDKNSNSIIREEFVVSNTAMMMYDPMIE